MSNLLEKASIVTTPTAYDNGKILSVKPALSLGSNLIDYDNITYGSGGWSLVNDKWVFDDATSGYLFVDNLDVEVGQKYQVTVNISISSGDANFRIASGNSQTLLFNYTDFADGETTFETTVTGVDGILERLFAATGLNDNPFTLNSISVNKITEADFDFTRNSSATRVNSQGLIEDVQILSSNLVSNGDFSQEGSELVTNGNFATDSDWAKGTGWSISGGAASCDGTQTSNSVLVSAANLSLGSGNLFKITFNVSNYISGSLDVVTLVGTGGPEFSGVNANGSYTAYSFGASTGDGKIQFIADFNFIGSIDNVSVREVGQDWTLGTGWSIGEDKAVKSVSATDTNLYQSSVFTVGKTYKIVFNIESISGTIWVSGISDFIQHTTAGEKTIISTASSTNLTFRSSGLSEVEITNISVKEVGMDWELGSGWEIGNNVAINDGTINAIYTQKAIQQGKKYVCKVDITFQGAGVAYWRLGNTTNLGVMSVDGTITQTLTGSANGNYIGIFANTAITITNISVIEITDDTNLPRINYEGFSYQDALGSEEIVNGDFATDSDWIKGTGWSISGGTANCDGTQTSNSNLLQSNTATSGNTYKITYTITNYVSGTFKSVLGVGGVVRNSNGVYSEYITATSSSFLLQANSDFIGSIDNVSLKEYLGQEVVPDSGCGSWLFEPQSTNLITQSETFSDWLTLGGRSQITINNAISPDGTQNAAKLEQILATGDASIRFTGLTPGVKYTFSLYAKKGNHDNIALDISDIYTVFTLTDNWVRYEITETSTFNFVDISIRNGVVGSYFYIWGAQVEQQSYATSYIPTSGSSVTRNRDLCANGGSLATINSTEGVLYAEIAALANDGTTRAIYVSNGTTANRFWLEFDAAANRFEARYIANGTTSANFFHTVPDITDFNKIAFKWKENDFSLYVNGLEVGNDTSGSAISADTLNRIDFHNQASSSVQNFFGKTKAVAVWKEALSDQELTELTTI